MSCLALDPATITGWAVTIEQSGTWDLSVRRDESGGMRLLRLEAKLNEVAASVSSPLKLVVYEAARHAAPGMQGPLVVQAMFQAIIQRWCLTRNIEFRGYSATEVKRIATGKGVADKAKMVAVAKARFPGLSIIDHNHADALFLLLLAERDFGSVLAAA